MVWSFGVLLLCQTLGEVMRSATGLPIPGTVFGILLLLAGLSCAGRRGTAGLPAADALLPYLSMLFVPPGVAGLQQLGRLPHAWTLAPCLLLSSVAALVVTGHLAQWLIRLQVRRHEGRAVQLVAGAVSCSRS